MRKLAILSALLASAFLFAPPADAQTARVVASCSTPPVVNPVGALIPLVVDVNGNLCSTGGAPPAGSGTAGFPAGATPVTSSATGTTGAVVATLPAAAGKTTYICGFNATGNEAATGAIVAVTVAGTISGSLNYFIAHSVTPTLGNLNNTFTPCVPSSAVNTAITVTSAADAAGTNVAVTAWGYQQ